MSTSKGFIVETSTPNGQPCVYHVSLRSHSPPTNRTTWQQQQQPHSPQLRARASPKLSAVPLRMVNGKMHALATTSMPVLLGGPPRFRVVSTAEEAALNALHDSREKLYAEARRAGAAEALLKERTARLEEVAQQVRDGQERASSKERHTPRLMSSSTTSSLGFGSDVHGGGCSTRVRAASCSSVDRCGYEADLQCERSVRDKLTEKLINAECEATKARQSEAEYRSRAENSAREVEDLSTKLAAADCFGEALNRDVCDLRNRLTESSQRYSDVETALQKMTAERNQLLAAIAENVEKSAAQEDEMEKLRRRVLEMEQESAEANQKLEAAAASAKVAVQERQEVEVAFRSYREHHHLQDHQLLPVIAELNNKVETLSHKVEIAAAELGAEQGSAVELKVKNLTLEKQLRNMEHTRSEMHNTIQELKGSIRVCCRVRPVALDVAMAVQAVEQVNSVSVNHCGENHSFTFDKVFGPTASQVDVFKEVDGLVQSALDGYKVCIFAYGQTGSGKTYTMQGSSACTSAGVVPRALAKIFEASELMRDTGWAWSLQVSILEVYNESLRDLLRGNADSAAGPAERHIIVQNATWGTLVTGLTCVKVESMEHINELLLRASKQRACGNTDMNADSSRSHLVTALYLKGTHEDEGTELCGALHLVDLAGSERLERSGSQGERLKETQNINKSLSSLAHVISAKLEGRAHVPYRNSKLTHLMEPCLSGQGKTLMLVNVQADQDSTHETLCSLRFARQVSQCNTGGRARRSVKSLVDVPLLPNKGSAVAVTSSSAPSILPTRPLTARSVRPSTSLTREQGSSSSPRPLGPGPRKSRSSERPGAKQHS